MRAEWKSYWKLFFSKTLGGLKWSALLCAVFFVIYLPILKPSEYLLSLEICVGYALSVQFYLMLFMGVAMAFHTYQNIRYRVSRKPANWIYFLMSGLGSCVGLVQGIYIKSYLLGGERPGYPEVMFSLLTGAFITMMFVFRGLYKDAKEKNSRLKAANTEAELHVFKNQMQPHFLFNSLNSLMSLIETKSQDASTVTQNLANLYREILDNSSKHVATLDSEMGIVEKYLSLERFRFGERLAFSISKPAGADRIYLPPLVLQTLVENAVKHGIANVVDRGAVSVDVAPREGGYVATITNTGTLRPSSSRTGTGLENSRARLGLMYGDRHNFRIQQVAGDVQASFWFSGESFQ